MEILNAIVLFHGVVFPSDISNFGGCYMIKTDEGIVTIKGTSAEIFADLKCIFHVFDSNEELLKIFMRAVISREEELKEE